MINLGEYIEIGSYGHRQDLELALSNDFSRLQKHLKAELKNCGGVRINLSPYDSGTVLERIRAAEGREANWVVTFDGVMCCLNRKSTEVFKYQFAE